MVIFGILVALWAIIYIAFRTPPVQRWVTGKISEQLSKQLNTKVSLDGLDIDWFDEVVLDGVYVEDQQQDTLLYVKQFRLNIEPSALFNKTIYVRLIEITGVYINLYQLEGQEDLNFAFIPEAFASEDPQPADTTTSAWTFDLYRIALNNIRFDYEAEGTEMNLALNKLAMLFETLGLEESYIQGDELTIDGLQFAMAVPPATADSAVANAAAAVDTAAVDTTAVAAAADAAPADTVALDSADVLNPSGFAYALNELNITNSQITYRVKQTDVAESQQLNFENMALEDLNTSVEDLQIGENDIQLHLQQLAFTEVNSGFALKKLEARAQVDMPQVAGELLSLETSHSQLKGGMQISMTLADDMQELVKSLKFDSEFNQTIIGMADAAYFTDALDSLPAVRQLSPTLSWQIHIADGAGEVNNLLFNIEDKASLNATMAFSNLPQALDSASQESPYFSMNLEALKADLGFIQQFTDDSVDQYLQNMGNEPLVLTASAEGYLNDLKADAKVQSGLGELVTVANYKQNKNNVADINAQLSGERLDIRQLMKVLGNPDSVANAYGQLTFHATAAAQSIMSPQDTTLNRADVKLTVDRFDYNDYTYQDLTLQSLLVKDSLQAEMAYQDSLMELHLNAKASLKKNDPRYAMNLQLKNANLFRLHLVNDSVIVQNVLVKAEARGNTPDDIVGYVRMSDMHVIKDTAEYHMDSLMLTAEKNGDTRTILLNSDEMQARLTGQFDMEHLPVAIEDFQQHYFAAYETPASGVDTVKTNDSPLQHLEFTFDIEKTPVLAMAFVPELTIPEPLHSEGSFNSRERSLQLDLKAPHITYGENAIDSLFINAHTTEKTIDLTLETNYTKVGGTTIPEVLFAGSLSGSTDRNMPASRQKLTTTDLDFNLKMGAEDSPYRLDLAALLSSRGDTTTLRLKESELVLRDQAWQIPPDATLVYATDYLNINEFFLHQDGQEIFVTTDNSNGKSDLKLAISQLALGPFLDAFDLEEYGVKGLLEGDVLVENMFVPGKITAALAINDLEVKNQDIGDFKVNAQKDSPESEGKDLMSLLMTLQGPNNDLKVEGSYNLAAEQDNLDLQLDLNQLQLEPWQVFAEDLIAELEGVLRANMKITGSPTDPVINGQFAVADEVLLRTTITGTPYYLPEQTIGFEGKVIRLNDFTVLDSARNPATLAGTVNFTNLTDPTVDLSFKTQEFIAVNSEEYENPNFYGRAVATASMEMEGPVSNLVITGDVGVDEGTDMVISTVGGDEEVSQANFIEFVDKNAFLAADSVTADSVQTVASGDSVVVSGFDLSTHVTINPQARFTILIDPVNGDQVVASGEADLQIDMTPTGDINMQGTYELNSGSYQLSFAGLVRKEFTVREGSTISWTGDPANADMNLTAVYTAETTLEGLFTPDMMQNPQVKQAVTTEQEVNVLLNISGTLDAPQLSFDIEAPELASGGASVQLVQDIILQIQQNETELYKQVFGLIVLNRFIPTSGGLGTSEGGGTLASVNEKIDSSVSQLLSTQLSSLTEQYLGGVEVNVGLQSDENQAGQTALADRNLDVELSKSLFNDRLTVSVGGTTTIDGGQGGSSNSGSGGFMGQFEVLYRIDRSGNLNIRIFREPEQNSLLRQVEDNKGVSVYYQKSFDELFGKRSDNVLRSRPVEEEEEDNNVSAPPQDTVIESSQKKKRGEE